MVQASRIPEGKGPCIPSVSVSEYAKSPDETAEGSGYGGHTGFSGRWPEEHHKNPVLFPNCLLPAGEAFPAEGTEKYLYCLRTVPASMKMK